MYNNILNFDTRKVEIEEIKEHYDYYMKLITIGRGLLNSGNKKESRDVLKIISDSLRLEHNYYDKVKFHDVLHKNNNPIEKDYCQGIYEACIHIRNPNKYSMLSSNLYDVEYYLRYWIKNHLIAVDSAVSE